MLNWNTDEKKFERLHPKEYKFWRLTQLINYGLDGEILDTKELIAAWSTIKDRISPDRQKVIEFLVWGKKWHKEPGLLPDRSNYWIWQSRKRIS